jgi:hypothetical protein
MPSIDQIKSELTAKFKGSLKGFDTPCQHACLLMWIKTVYALCVMRLLVWVLDIW